MEQKSAVADGVKIDYYQKGREPRWLIVSGVHGDEAGVVASVERCLRSRGAALPDFIWIPVASPSAVRRGTRENEHGVNLNRAFFDRPREPEAAAVLAVIGDRHFDLCATFHEDTSTDRLFYLYDEIHDARETPAMKKLFVEIAGLGLKFYDGLDDADPALANHIQNGYFSGLWKRKPGEAVPDNGMLESYLARRGQAGRIYTVETPGKAASETKDGMVAAMFEYLKKEHGGQ